MPFDESRIQIDETGYNFVEVYPEEIFKWGGMCICNGCNEQFVKDNMYLCFAAADVYCKDCFDDMRKRWKRNLSKEDIAFDLKLQDERALDWYKYHLDFNIGTLLHKINDKV